MNVHPQQDPQISKSDSKQKASNKWPSTTSFMISLQGKLSETGFTIIHGMDIPSVDVVANNRERIIGQVFFSYMPGFHLKKALELERTLNKYSPDLCIIIGAVEDTDIKLFTVGKNVLLVDIDMLLKTDFLIHLGELI